MTSSTNYVAGRLMCLDLGDKRIGMAISDELQISVRPLPAIVVTNWKAVLSGIRQAVASFDAKALVLGWPVRLDGSEGASVDKVRHTAEKLEKSLRLPIFFQDERLTTFAAEERLAEMGIPRTEWKSQVDSQAASIILADFISRVASPRVRLESDE